MTDDRNRVPSDVSWICGFGRRIDELVPSRRLSGREAMGAPPSVVGINRVGRGEVQPTAFAGTIRMGWRKETSNGGRSEEGYAFIVVGYRSAWIRQEQMRRCEAVRAVSVGPLDSGQRNRSLS